MSGDLRKKEVVITFTETEEGTSTSMKGSGIESTTLLGLLSSLQHQLLVHQATKNEAQQS